MEDKREDKNLNEAEGRVVEAEKKKLALKAVNPMIFMVVIIAICAIASISFRPAHMTACWMRPAAER